jgi:hypothetical protein
MNKIQDANSKQNSRSLLNFAVKNPSWIFTVKSLYQFLNFGGVCYFLSNLGLFALKILLKNK